MNIDNFVITLRRDREAAHRARASAGSNPRPDQSLPPAAEVRSAARPQP